MSKQDLIDDYFDGRMSETEMKEFEAQLNTDPELQREFNIQKEIIETIKGVRKAELKARLDNVQVGGGFTSSFSFTKIATSVVIIAGIGIGGYFYLNEEPKEEIKDQADEIVDTGVPDKDEKQSPELEDKEEETTEKEEREEQTDEMKSEKQEEIKDQTTEKTVPQPVTPDVIEEFDDEEKSTDIAIPENNLINNSNFSRSRVDIEIKKDANYDFHYLYTGDKLFLYGNFTDTGEPYQILEIKKSISDSMFLYYKEKFYAIDRDKKEISPLIEITNDEIKEKLEEIKNK